MRNRLIIGASISALVAFFVVPAVGATPKAVKQTPALFYVGTGVSDLTPDSGVQVYSGGFGQSPPLTAANETEPDSTLSARAIFISNGHRCVALVEVDSQGLFAALQQGLQYGTVGMRQDAAKAVGQTSTCKGSLSADDIIVQGSHSHSAPTAMGIWGPVETAYLKQIHDGVVSAVAHAAATARAANLQYATVDAPYLDNVYTAQTDSYQGWQQDGQVSVLRAVDPTTGETIATYANVPAHPDIVNGAGSKVLTADYFGFARTALQNDLGGTAIVAPGTLGREESPIQVGGVNLSKYYAREVTSLITHALTTAKYVDSNTIGSANTFVQAPGTNVLLLSLVAAWSTWDQMPADQRQQLQDNVAYPIDRANTPPYQTGAVVGTPTTALRIGPVAYVSLNGEAFPEVRHSIAANVSGVSMLVGLSLGQDQLGYYAPTSSWAFMNGVAPYHSDHFEYNISPVLGDQIVQAQVGNLRSLGFDGSSLPLAHPDNNDYAAMLHPGVQGLAYPAEVDAGPSGTADVSLQSFYSDGSLKDSAGVAPGRDSNGVQWNFGDGMTYNDVYGGRTGPVFTHTFGLGSHTLSLIAHDASGDASNTWTMNVVVHPQLVAGITKTTNANGSVTYAGSARGGDGNVLAWRWYFSDGSVAYGRTVTHAAMPVVLKVTDGTATIASASA